MKPRQPCVSRANPDAVGDESDFEERNVRAVVLLFSEDCARGVFVRGGRQLGAFLVLEVCAPGRLDEEDGESDDDEDDAVEVADVPVDLAELFGHLRVLHLLCVSPAYCRWCFG